MILKVLKAIRLKESVVRRLKECIVAKIERECGENE